MKMKTLLIFALILVMAGSLFVGTAAAGGAEVPFKAYYPVTDVATFDPSCGCMQQVFTPGGDGLASHMGQSLFSGNAQAWYGDTIIQIGNGTLIAANGDYLTVHYEGTAVVIDHGQHAVADGWFEITGGSGRFENVTGGGTYHVFAYLSGEQPNDLWFDGHLHNP